MRGLLSVLSIMLVMTGCSNASAPKPMIQSEQSDALSVSDFKALWQATNVEMNRTFPDYIHLEVNATIDQKVERITVTASPHSKKERFLMMSCWAQVITTMTGTVEGTHVSTLFRAMGIDPNADLAELTGATVNLNGDTYRSWREGQVYTFTFEEGGV
jgi:hypothetical protein